MHVIRKFELLDGDWTTQMLNMSYLILFNDTD